MKNFYLALFIILLQIIASAQNTVTNLYAFYRDGQVFVTWDNLTTTGVRYNLYKSSDPILHGWQLSTAENLGAVRDNSAKNLRMSSIYGNNQYFKIDSAGAQLASNKGLFVVTSTEQGSFYYAVTTTVNSSEDTTIQFGTNSLQSPITESISMPRPVWQITQTVQDKVLEIYAQFVSKVTSSIYPQMTNEGSYAFHFAIYKQGFLPSHPITFHMRPGGVSFLSSLKGIGNSNEWIISIDDWLPDGSVGSQLGSLYYGYHEDYDIYTYSNPIPTTGTVYNYTAARVSHTINWCLRNLPLDTTRVYLRGYSLGAIGVALNFYMLAEKVAAVIMDAPIFDNSNSTFAGYADLLWGSYATNLMTNEGFTRNQRTNCNQMLSIKRNSSMPVMYSFCGRYDENVGWAEKVVFYDSVNNTNHGGFHFWSPTNHANTMTQWLPNFPNFSFFTRYRTNLSYPAFSNCCINNNPGDGTPTNGDLIGSINGYLDWKDNIADSIEYYEISLFIKDLLYTGGTLTAPDSGTTDVTLRRLQKFSVPTGETIFWKNFKNGSIVQQGSFTYDGGLITIPGVKVYKDTSRIKVYYIPVEVDDKMLIPSQFALEQNYPNPFNPSTTFRYSIPQTSKVMIKVYDVLGNEVATLMDEEKSVGTYELTWNAADLPSGIYFYQLQAGEFIQTRKMILLK